MANVLFRLLVACASVVVIPVTVSAQTFYSVEDCQFEYQRLTEKRKEITKQSYDCVFSGELVWGEAQSCVIGDGPPRLHSEQSAYVQCEPYEIQQCEVETEIRAVKATCDEMTAALADKVKNQGDQEAAATLGNLINEGGSNAASVQTLLNEANLRRQAVGVPKTMFLGVYTNEKLLTALGETPPLASSLANKFLSKVPSKEFIDFTSTLSSVSQAVPNAYLAVTKGLQGFFPSYDPDSDTPLSDEDMANLAELLTEKSADKLMSENAGIRAIQEIALASILETHAQLQQMMTEAFENFEAGDKAVSDRTDQSFAYVREADKWLKDRERESRESELTTSGDGTTSGSQSGTACEQSTGVGDGLSTSSGNTSSRWSMGLDVCMCETGLDKREGVIDDNTPGADQFYQCMTGYGLGHYRP